MNSRFLGQLLLMGIPGTELDSETASRLKKIQPGGFILFGRNIQTAPQLRKLTDDLRDLSDLEPIITIDQEGGRVSRLKLIGNEPPNAVQLRDKNDPKLIETHGRLTGALLRLFGFNLDLCPVLDISYDDEADNSLRGRCWGHDSQEVISKAGCFNRAMRKEKILSCAKHFPSYGAISNDPHHDLPILEKSLENLLAEDLIPYTALSNEIDSVMIGHSACPNIDPENPRLPASLSKRIITDLLKNQLGNEGLILTDDLDMGAILNEYGFEETIHRSISAGNDLAMICHRVEMVEEAKKHLEALPHPILDRALENIERFKKKLAPPTPFSIEAHQHLDRQVWDLRVAVLGEEAAQNRSPEDGKRSPVELY